MNDKVLEFLSTPDSYPESTTSIEHIETHISHIFILDNVAYKVKKAIHLPFLDFSNLEERKKCCEKEVLLNSRFARDMYRGVAAIYETSNGLSFNGPGTPIEYAVVMRRLDRDSLFSELLSREELSYALVEKISRNIAKFHRVANTSPSFWGFNQARAEVLANISVMESHRKTIDQDLIAKLRLHSENELVLCESLIRARQSTHVKALHGDLHLGNIALLDGEPVLFDGIEFNDELACCDVWADFAFFLMDLQYRMRRDLSNVALNCYLEETDDYEGLALLPLYISYRAAVRAKIACIKIDTLSHEFQSEALRSAKRHAELSLRALSNSQGAVIAIGGLSGSGKSTLAREIAKRTDAVIVRSDVVRKHLLNIPLTERAGSSAYTNEMHGLTYEAMRKRALSAIKSRKTIILDAVHGSDSEKSAARELAEKTQRPFVGIWCELPLEEAIRRVSTRRLDASDADSTVVYNQDKSKLNAGSWEKLDSMLPADLLAEDVVSRFHSVISAI